jgi:tetratricopeptide (TPR) repeat protein
MSVKICVYAGATALMVVTGFAGPAAAQKSQAWTWCVNKENASPDIQIGGCTTVIQSDKETKENLASAFFNRGLAHVDKGQHDRAIRDFDQVIKLDPNDADAFNNRCLVRALIGQLEQALMDCDTSVNLKPDDANMLDSRGIVHLKRNDLGKAIADYDAALKIDPEKAGSLYGRGLAKQKTGDSVGGNSDMAAAKAINATIDDAFAGFGVK